jgi:hypothetical protein
VVCLDCGEFIRRLRIHSEPSIPHQVAAFRAFVDAIESPIPDRLAA